MLHIYRRSQPAVIKAFVGVKFNVFCFVPFFIFHFGTHFAKSNIKSLMVPQRSVENFLFVLVGKLNIAQLGLLLKVNFTSDFNSFMTEVPII